MMKPLFVLMQLMLLLLISDYIVDSVTVGSDIVADATFDVGSVIPVTVNNATVPYETASIGTGTVHIADICPVTVEVAAVACASTASVNATTVADAPTGISAVSSLINSWLILPVVVISL